MIKGPECDTVAQRLQWVGPRSRKESQPQILVRGSPITDQTACHMGWYTPCPQSEGLCYIVPIRGLQRVLQCRVCRVDDTTTSSRVWLLLLLGNVVVVVVMPDIAIDHKTSVGCL